MRKLLLLILLLISAPSAQLQGHVYDSNQTALDDIPVEAYMDGRQVAVTYTDLDGKYSFELSPGPYEIWVLGGTEKKTVELGERPEYLDFEIILAAKNETDPGGDPAVPVAFFAAVVLLIAAYLLYSRAKKPPVAEEEAEETPAPQAPQEDEVAILSREEKRLEAAIDEAARDLKGGKIKKEEYGTLVSDYEETLREVKEKLSEL